VDEQAQDISKEDWIAKERSASPNISPVAAQKGRKGSTPMAKASAYDVIHALGSTQLNLISTNSTQLCFFTSYPQMNDASTPERKHGISVSFFRTGTLISGDASPL